MTIIRKKRKILGREDNTGFLIKGGKVVPANYDIIDKTNAELRKKCAKQKENDAEALIVAHDMVAGQSCDNCCGKSDYSFIAIDDASVIKIDPVVIAEMDSDSIKKSVEQGMNEVGIGTIAHDMVAGGIYDDVANGPVLTKKRRF